jgi:hypothetical protein
MTVLMDKQLYVFDVVTGNQPDVAITFVKDDAAANLVSGASSSGLVSGKELSKQDIVAMRPKFDPELLVGFVRQANDAELLRRLYPDLYRDYSWRPADYPWETNGVKTVVNHIHRFSEGDAVVLTGSVTNNTGQPLGFAARAVQVSVNDSEIHPAKLTDCKQPIAPGETVPIVVVLQGDIDGARANLSLLNSFRIVPPQGVDPYSKSYGYNNSTQPKTALSGDGKKVIQKTRHD